MWIVWQWSRGLCVLMAIWCTTVQAEEPGPWRYLLSSSRYSVNIEEFRLSHADLGLEGQPPWSVEKVVLQGGRQTGCELLVIETESLKITVIPTRGMSILSVESGELRLGWNSPVQEVVHPSFINLESRGGLGWTEGFNEWLVRCGLEFAGHPGTDVFTTNTGDRGEMELTLHGKIGNIPASEVELLVDPQPPHRITLRGLVSERVFFGPKLDLTTELSLVPGESTWRIVDTIVNAGSADQEFEIIYHTNFGWNLLEEGSIICLPASSVRPMNQTAVEGLENWMTYRGPTPGFVEQVYLIEPLSDANDRVLAVLVNADRTRGATLRWELRELPHFTLWKNTATVEDGYVTGLEPGTCYPFHRSVERAAGRLPVLPAGQSRSFTLEFGVLMDETAVQQTLNEISALQAGTEVHLIPEPPAPPE